MAHGSMPFLGINAIERITPVLEILVDATKVLSLVLLESVGEHYYQRGETMDVVTPSQMDRIFQVTDAMSIHREGVIVPLGPDGSGSVRLVGNKVEVTVPAEGAFDDWIAGLRDQLDTLDLVGVRKAEM